MRGGMKDEWKNDSGCIGRNDNALNSRLLGSVQQGKNHRFGHERQSRGFIRFLTDSAGNLEGDAV